ncbi:MAG: ChaN family lipoprotein [Chromatiales bacterium]|nr:ChaN family lipoprotein [Chromatiales bacterium]
MSTAGATCAVGMLVLSGCASDRAPGAGSATAHPLESRIWSVREGVFIDDEELVGRLTAADQVLLGEIHINPDHHRLQERLIGEFTERDLRPAIVFEIFERDQQPAIDAARSAPQPDPDQLAEATGVMDSGWDWPDYRPLVAQALRDGLPIVAGNAPAADMRKVGMQGLDALPADRRALLEQTGPLPAPAHDALTQTIVDSHCGHVTGDMADRLVVAQRLRDATMADAMLTADGRPTVLIAGAGHARRDYGVPFYVLARQPGLAVASVSFVEVRDGHLDPQAYVDQIETLPAPFDYLWFTSRVLADDPCEQFKDSFKKFGEHAGRSED